MNEFQLLLSPTWNNVHYENVRDDELHDWAKQESLPQEPLSAPFVTPSLPTPHKPLEHTAEKTSAEAENTLEKLQQELEDLADKKLIDNDSLQYELLVKNTPALGVRIILGLFLKIAHEKTGICLTKESKVSRSTIRRAKNGKLIQNDNLLALVKSLKNQNLNRFIIQSDFPKNLKEKVKLLFPNVDFPSFEQKPANDYLSLADNDKLVNKKKRKASIHNGISKKLKTPLPICLNSQDSQKLPTANLPSCRFVY